MSDNLKESTGIRINYKHLLILLAACLVVYSNTLRNGFSNYDDPEEILQNTTLTDTTLPGIIKLFAKPKIWGFYAPVKNLVHMLNYSVTGHFNPVLFHIVNDTLHILTVFCCYVFLILLTKNLRLAFLTSLLFAIHPCHSQPINGSSARGLLMVGLFSFLCLIFYIMSERGELSQKNTQTDIIKDKKYGIYYSLSIICFFLGMFSHPTMITLPITIFVYQAFIVEDNNTIYRRILRSLARVAPFFFIQIFYFAVIHLYFHSITKMTPVTETYANHSTWLLKDAGLLASYFINTLYPVNSDYGNPVILTTVEIILMFIGMVLFFRVGLWKLKKKRWRLLAPSVFFFSLIPSLVLVYSYSNINLRYLYFPSIGIYMLLVYILDQYISDNRENNAAVKIFFYAVIIFMLLFLSNTSYDRNKI